MLARLCKVERSVFLDWSMPTLFALGGELMGKFIDLTGRRFGRLIAMRRIGTKNLRAYWQCECDCGNHVNVSNTSLIQGHTKSCGCYNREKAIGCNNPNWNNGSSFEPYCPLFNNELRKRIRLFFENQCVVCGKPQSENLTTTGRVLQLACHHVEYDKESCCDGKPVHFAALCVNCHGKTNFNRQRWESMLHRIIDEIYNGKSYYTKEEYYRWFYHF